MRSSSGLRALCEELSTSDLVPAEKQTAGWARAPTALRAAPPELRPITGAKAKSTVVRDSTFTASQTPFAAPATNVFVVESRWPGVTTSGDVRPMRRF
jgi:hypothetical protein